MERFAQVVRWSGRCVVLCLLVAVAVPAIVASHSEVALRPPRPGMSQRQQAVRRVRDQWEAEQPPAKECTTGPRLVDDVIVYDSVEQEAQVVSFDQALALAKAGRVHVELYCG